MKTPLSLPVEQIAKLAPKHQQHGSPIGALISLDELASLGITDITHVLNKHLAMRSSRA